MKIAICNANQAILSQLHRHIQDSASIFGSNAEVHFFTDPLELWSTLHRGTTYIAVILDIDISGINGFEMGKAIKRRCRDTKIIFVTENMDYAVLGYTIPAFRYIHYAEINEHISECIQSLLTQYYVSHRILYPIVTGQVKGLSTDSIEYIFGVSKTESVIWVKNDKCKSINAAYGIDQLEILLKSFPFVRLQKNYLANAKYIVKLVNKYAVMQSGVVIPVNRTRYQEIRSSYHRGRRSQVYHPE